MGGSQFDFGANASDFHFAGEKRERRPPIGAVAGGDAGDGAIRRHEEPREFSIDDEQVFLRRSVLPAHFARPAEIGDAGFGTGDAAAFAVNL